MTEKEFLKMLADLIDTEKILTLETKLAEIEEWDSLSFISFLSHCNSKLGKNLTPDELKTAETVADLFKFVGEK
ncbi:MAG: hypothetical protein IJT73_06440 [Selenomonadaceae bacterium]|nr:hypothetical protein [Selenomonadaceae bacterium]